MQELGGQRRCRGGGKDTARINEPFVSEERLETPAGFGQKRSRTKIALLDVTGRAGKVNSYTKKPVYYF